MRNQPSNQSRDNNTWRSKSPSRQAGCFCLETEDQKSNSSIRTNRRSNTSKESHFKYVPSQRKANSYEKPCLPYYVVPVLYVPQKVLSSEEIRPSSSTNKNTMSFVLKERKESKERSMINVDDIPCIPCELAKKSKQNKDSYEKEENLINDVNVDPSCTGYINTCYTQSSTSLIDDTTYQDYAIPNPTLKKSGSPVNVHYQDRYYRRESDPNQRQDRSAHQRYPQQWQRFPSTQQNKFESYHLPKSNVRVRWNPECNCYETVEEIIVNEVTQVYQGDDNRRMYVRNRNLIPTPEPQRVRVSKQKNVVQQRCYQQPCYRNDQNYMDDQMYRDTEVEKNRQMPLNRQAMRYQDSIDQTHFNDNYTQEDGINEQTSTLSCEKVPKVVKKVSSLLGAQYTCEPSQEVGMMMFSQKTAPQPSPQPHETYTIEPYRLGEDSVLSVIPQSRKGKRGKAPKESQTAFDENIDSTYVATDEPLRETKSTQTVDAAARNVTTSTQTNRALRTFETCPPPYIEQIGEQVGVTARPRTRESSPSPMRYRRAPSPVKQFSGDSKKMTIMKTAEMLQKPVTNQVSSTCPIRQQQKIKRRKPRTSLSPG